MPEKTQTPSSDFTPLQGQYLAFIYAYTQINRRPPAESDFQNYFEVTAPSVHQMILTLERAGLIERIPRAARSMTLRVPPESLPLLRRPEQPVKTSVPRY